MVKINISFVFFDTHNIWIKAVFFIFIIILVNMRIYLKRKTSLKGKRVSI